MLSDNQDYQRQEQLYNRLEGRLAKQLKLELDQTIGQTSELYLVYGQSVLLPASPLILDHATRLGIMLNSNAQLSINVFHKYSHKQLAELFEDVQAAISPHDLYQQYLNQNLLSNSQLIASNTFSQIKQAIKESFADGASEAEIAKQILTVQKISKPRALMIARTEVHNAATYTQEASLKDYQKRTGKTVYKKWIPVRDGRTRDTHADMANHPPIPVDEKFDVGGARMSRPGDPSAPAREVINCRCRLGYARKP